MAKYNTLKVDGLSIDHSSLDEDKIVLLMNQISAQIEGCVDNLGSFADIKSIECYETYSGIAESTHIKFTTRQLEAYGNSLTFIPSSNKIEDYDYAELTKFKVQEDE